MQGVHEEMSDGSLAYMMNTKVHEYAAGEEIEVVLPKVGGGFGTITIEEWHRQQRDDWTPHHT